MAKTSLTVTTHATGTASGYMPGFGNDPETEVLPDALLQGVKSPQECADNPYGVQLSRTTFTAPHHQNKRIWRCRIWTSVKHAGRFSRVDVPHWTSAPHVMRGGIPLDQCSRDPVPHTAQKLGNPMPFMNEPRFPQHLTVFAARPAPLRNDDTPCRGSLQKHFTGTPEGSWAG